MTGARLPRTVLGQYGTWTVADLRARFVGEPGERDRYVVEVTGTVTSWRVAIRARPDSLLDRDGEPRMGRCVVVGHGADLDAAQIDASDRLDEAAGAREQVCQARGAEERS